jgi:hypothetical protein
MVHSRSSSLGDDYYNYSSYGEEEYDAYDTFPVPPAQTQHAQQRYSQQQYQPQYQPQYQYQQRPTSAGRAGPPAQISVPSFAAFRSHASSIPTASHSAALRRPTIPFKPAHSPRAASFSLAERASPRLADPASRPLSLDSPVPHQPDRLASVITPPLTDAAQRRDR